MFTARYGLKFYTRIIYASVTFTKLISAIAFKIIYLSKNISSSNNSTSVRLYEVYF